MDPMRIVDATPDVMKLLTLFKSFVDATHDAYTASRDIRNVVGNMADLSKSKGWYVALRYTSLLIEARAFRMLLDFIGQQRYDNEGHFWCGFYAQLEHAWAIGDPTVKGQIIDLLDQTIPQGKLQSSYVKIWTQLIADTFGQPHWKDLALERQH